MATATVEGNAATLYAHDKRLTKVEECQEQLLAKFDWNTRLLIATLAAVVTTLGHQLLNR